MFCRECGKEIPDNANHCPECGAEIIRESSSGDVVEKESFFKKNKKIVTGCCIGLVVVFLLIAIGSIFTDNHNNEDNHISNSLDDMNLSESEFKGLCKEIEFKKWEKNSDNYYGNRTMVSGKVVQIMEDKDGGIIRLAVDGDYENIVAVIYSGSNDVVEDDYITAYGYVYQDYSYESQANYKITIPCLDARYIDDAS